MTTTSPPDPELTLLAIHGNGGGGFRFARIMPHLPATIRFEAPTLPGFADRPADPALRTMRDYADHIADLAAALPAPRVLLGTGIGGAFLLELMQREQPPVEGLILHAPVGTRLESRRFPWLMKLPGMRAFGQWLFSARLARPLFKRLLFQDFRQVPAADLDRFFDEYRRCAVFGQMFDIISAEWYDSLGPSHLPTALLWGAEERILNPDHIADYQALLPAATVHLIDGWDHFPMMEQPAAYARVIVDLARSLVTPAA